MQISEMLFNLYSVLSSQADLDLIDTLALVPTRKSLVTLLVDGFDGPIKTTGSWLDAFRDFTPCQ